MVLSLPMQTCTWAPTTFAGPAVVRATDPRPAPPQGEDLTRLMAARVQHIEALGIDNLLIAQRWWGDASAIEGSSLDCLAMTAWFASITDNINLITAIHPGFFSPTAIAKWGASIDNITQGRWAINVTSGWNLEEFSMYGIDPLSHDERYQRSEEFIEVLRGAWDNPVFSYNGSYYSASKLAMQPRPTRPLQVFQGGQSDAAIHMAVQHSDWMFLNGGQPEALRSTINKVREAAAATNRCPRFAVYAIPLCRDTDAQAWAEIDAMLARIDPALLEQRRARLAGAQGMWSNADKLAMLDTNEGYSTGLIGSPATITQRIEELESLGIDMLHLGLGDKAFETDVLPTLTGA